MKWMHNLCVFVTVFVILGEGFGDNCENNEIEDPFKFLECNEKHLNLVEEDEIVLVLGNTGSGKTTLILLLTENNDQLTSIKTADNEYIIDDTSNKIGHGISSKTLIPEKFIDQETNTVYYDCPGFKDTRNSATDIAAVYFLKKTLDHARAVKIVLTVSHSSVKSAGDRTDFINLLKHFNELVKNINKYNSSISLVVTKVEKEFKYDDYGDFPQMLNDAQMIDKVAEYLSNLKTYLGEQNSMNIIQIVDILLRKNGNSYENIGIFRRPSMGGKLSKLRLVQEGRLRIKDIIRDMTYTETDFDDFGYTVSDKTKLDVVKWTRRFNEDFSGVVDSVAKLLENYFVLRSFEHENAQKYFTKEYALIRRKIGDMKEATVEEFSNIFLEYARRYTKDVVLETIRRKSDHVAFLQLVSNEDFDLRPSMWIEPLYRLSNRLEDLKDWYDFLADVVEKLSIYNFAKGVREILKQPDIKVNDVIRRFSEKELIEIETYDKIYNIDKTEANEKYFMQMLTSVLKNQTIITCSKEKLVVEGNYVFMSDVPNCPSRRIEIFCYNTLFFDRNFSRIGDMVKTFVVAPKWVVWKKQIIDLSGTDGLDLPAPKRGRDGIAGLPGTSGGSFFGVVSETFNMHLLSINVAGGNGGRGQDGGQGYDSQYVYEFTVPSTKSTTENQDIKKWYPNLKINVESEKSGVYLLYNYHEKIYKIEDFGAEGKEGFMPGPGGYGGFSGDVDINYLDKRIHITILEQKGKQGVVGKCGPGGPGANCIIYTVKHVYEFHFYFVVIVPLNKWYLLSKKEYKNPPGKCNNNINPNVESNLPQSSTISRKDKLLTINDYKLHLLQHVNEVIDPKPLINFYIQLSDSPKTHDLYDSIDFLTEVKNLETIPNKNNFIPIYRSLMIRIERFASFKRLDVETKKILTYIYSSALVQINDLEASSNNALIIQLDDYLNTVKTNIAAMLSSRQEIIKYSTGLEYEQRIASKITELTKLIDNKIIPEIPVIQKAIDVEIAQHVEEVNILQHDYGRYRNMLFDQMRARRVSGVFGVFASIASCFGKIGEYVGKGISGLSDWVGLSRKPNMEQPALPPAIFTSVNNTKSLITKYVERKTEVFHDIIEEIEMEIETNSTFQHLLPQLAELKSRSIDNFDALDSLQNELDALLNILDSDRKKRSITKRFKRIKMAFKVARTSVDVYLKYRSDANALENLSGAIANTDKTINSINVYEKYMETFSYTLHRIVDDLTSYTLTDSLDLSRWEIQKSIRTMKRFVVESTRGFSVENDLVDLTEELQETLNALVDVYDRIEEYQKEKQLLDYIQLMTSTDVRNVNVKNNTLRKTLWEIEYNIRTNLALKQYQLAINALKQYAFPFAHKYMNEFAIPKNLRSEDLDYLRSWIIHGIENLIKILSEQKTKTDSTVDAYVHETSNSELFFTWSNKRYGKLLTKLFSGEEVTLTSNVREKNVRNAMKFKKIHLNFTHINNGSLVGLNNYHIRLTHLGNSYYRCDDKYFVLSTESQRLQYSYKRDENGEWMSRNKILEKIEEGYYMLSPYALWNIQLIDVDGKGFSALRNLRGQVDVQLIGKGQYVTKDCDICKTNLEDYYKLDDIEEL